MEIKNGKYGRGVYSTKPIKKGETVEVCPIIEVPNGGIEEVEGQVRVKNTKPNAVSLQLSRYVFGWTSSLSALALGYGSLYNHSWTPNIRPIPDYDGRTISFVAVKDIAIGEELTFNYQYDPTAYDKLNKVEKQISTLVDKEIAHSKRLNEMQKQNTDEIYEQMYQKDEK